MIIWLKVFYNLVSSHKPKEVLRILFSVLHTVTLLPAFFFHEFSHIFLMVICACPFQTKIFYVLRFQRTTLLGFKWLINFQSYWEWEAILIAVAPLIGLILYMISSMIFLLTNHHWYSLLPFIYGVYARNTFNLSNQDKKTLSESFAKMRSKRNQITRRKQITLKFK